ncbi:Uma2 family endonuclease [Romeria aff. gracilis LEGE 07310]|uniref:Uma2 family endonuclease n=1 Tax=Vasconcelosia minhoensis LEGE 07310 TaxID=915328 RepID=A0A8J7DM11_9CYAN|nr:Uma2 family endonuclease [Romeria gracilis]MBE9078096.1 Uma2 family endonuclease [Romeria aff. gracilis LEGE 07310]
MVDQLAIPTDEVTFPDASQLITEDDAPVDNFPSAKQQRLLVSSLYSSLSNQVFLAEANVGVYHTVSQPAIVPDVFVSFDVQVPDEWWEKPNRCYLVWNFGKPPEIAIEVVSNKIGKELTDKFEIYEHMRVSYYAVYDPSLQLGGAALRLYELRGMHYAEMEESWLEQVSLGLTIWQGEFEGRQDSWLRWRNGDGSILLTGDERADQAQQRADQAQQRADRLAEYLRSQGIDPDQLPE